MGLLTLDELDRTVLQDFVLRKTPARALCRAQALLWLADGEDIGGVAETLGVSRQTVYNWVHRFERRDHLDLISRVADAPRSGRPPVALGIIDPLIDAVIDSDPRHFGYRYTGWTAPLLQDYLRKHHGIEVSSRSIGAAIERIRVGWKRPRHRLALRPETWRQSKGGSKEA